MKKSIYYNQDIKDLEMYQRLIQYWNIIFDRREKIQVLDNMNFNRNIFPEIIKINELLYLNQIEPGYTSPDGYNEMNQLIRELERSRLLKNTKNKKNVTNIVNNAGIGCGNGCTNVMNAVINSILKFTSQKFKNNNKIPEVILILPNYTVYVAQLSNIGMDVCTKFIYANRENGFLPTFEQVKNEVNDNTVAIIMTYPNNPAQSTYEGKNVMDLGRIVKYCKEKEVFLVVDNIYQDLIFGENRDFVEIFSLTDSLDYIIKVYGCSKDTPFYSGYRMGYWFGDPRIMDMYKYYISSTENSLNTYSLVFFAFNLYFKMKTITKAMITIDDMNLFKQGVFGWSQHINENSMFEKLMEIKLFEKYCERLNTANIIQKSAIEKIKKYVEQSGAFIDCVNQNIGNVLFIKVNPEYYTGNDDEFFNFILKKGRIGLLPGNVFGIQQDYKNIWFRITSIHDNCDNILNSLEKVEALVCNKKQGGVKCFANR